MKSETLDIRIKPDIKQKLREIAEIEKRSLTKQIELMIEKEYDRLKITAP